MQRRLWLLSAWLGLAAPALAQELTLRTVQQSGSLVKYAPDAGQHRPGLCLEMLRAVQRVDPGLRFSGLDRQMPLRRVERLLSEGQVDVVFCLLKSPEREKQWRYAAVPLYSIRHVVAQRAGDERDFETLAELAASSHHKPVLVMRGTALARRLMEADVAIAQVASEREALQMLMLGRADAVYGQDINLQRHVGDAGLASKVRFGRTIFHEESQFVALRADLPPAHEERLTHALRRLERDGTLRLLAEKYR
ncbi:ABC-type amino acid transport substrate-binding protein [Pelomonas aquatica]|uniref:ABC-type amino acid transport substrate-binding protein n=1 Tax=Pelomonas aquatica TaxID=431058 RepID=A0ABU1ZDE5_9BURK|nr:transporter substrate-binding domain-containing protein [Pelomonas aquatica]MDR7298642.1 ABC-type amino acid transport substrate-binding protein [Pelomonas aquatica]